MTTKRQVVSWDQFDEFNLVTISPVVIRFILSSSGTKPFKPSSSDFLTNKMLLLVSLLSRTLSNEFFLR